MGARLRVARKRKQLTLAKVGEKLGVSAQAVAQWEYGEAEPSIDTLAILTRLLGVHLSDLLGVQTGTVGAFIERFEQVLEIVPTAQSVIIDTAAKSAAHDGFYVVRLAKGATSGPIVARLVWPKEI